MTDPIKIMDEIERRYTADKGLPILISPGDWQSLRNAIEAQAEELAQARAQLAEFEPVEGSFIAAVKAEALREFAANKCCIDDYGDEYTTAVALQMEADRIEREAKES